MNMMNGNNGMMQNNAMNNNIGMMPNMNNVMNMNWMNNNNNNIKKGNNEDINNNFQNRMMFSIIFSKNPFETKVVVNTYPEEKLKDLIKKYRNKTGADDYYAYIYNANKLDPNDEKTISELELKPFSQIVVIPPMSISFDIRLLKSSQPCTKIYNGELKGLSKLCFLKEISSKLELDQLDKLPEKIFHNINFEKQKGYKFQIY
jgi:hypothetical protein